MPNLPDDYEPTDEDFDEETSEEDYSRNQVALLFNVTPKTVLRWTNDGVLTRNARKRYNKSDVDRLLKSQGKPAIEEVPGDAHLFTELTKGVQLANSHVERLFQMVERPLGAVVDGLLKSNEQMAKRLTDHDAAFLEMMKAYGEILMQKEEREAMQAREAVKTAMLANAAEQVLPLVPILLSQMLGKGSPKGVASAAKFISSLTPEQKAQFGMMAGAFEGEQKAAFEAMLKDMGISPTVEEQGEAAA